MTPNVTITTVIRPRRPFTGRGILFGLALSGAVLGGICGTVSHAFAGSCANDISRLNQAMKDQYVPWSWSNMFYCAVARGSDLRTDALVTRAQISAIAQDVSLATQLDRRGQERECKETLLSAKRLLHVW